jgi:hypothetical protein
MMILNSTKKRRERKAQSEKKWYSQHQKNKLIKKSRGVMLSSVTKKRKEGPDQQN